MDDNTKKFRALGKTKTIKGSILNPEVAGLRFILTLNNLLGTASCPLLPIFDKRWKKVREEGRGWYVARTGAYKLGALKITAVQSDTWVIHCLVQDEKLQVNVESLETCLKEICKLSKYEKGSVHISNILLDAIPELKDLVVKNLLEESVSVYFYEEV